MEIFKKLQKVDTYTNYPKDGVTMLGMDAIVDDTQLMHKAAKAILEKHCLPGDEVIAMATRGVPLATHLAAAGDMRMTTAKKELKIPTEHKVFGEDKTEYGSAHTEFERDRAEAIVEKGSPIWIVDDVYATGGSVRAARAPLVGGNHKGVFVLVVLELDTCIPPDVHYFAKFNPESNKWTPGDLCFVPSGIISVPNLGKSADQKMFKIIAAPGAMVLALDISLRSNVQIHPVRWDHFPEGAPDIEILYPEKLKDAEVVFVMDAQNQSSFHEQLQLLRILPKQGIARLTALVPYLPTATMDRVDSEGVLATLDTTMKMLTENMPHTKNGPVEIVLVDPHVTNSRFAAANNALVGTIHAISRDKHVNCADLVVFPDDGAKKRFRDMIIRQGNVRKFMSFTKLRTAEGVKLEPFDVCGARTAEELVRSCDDIVLVDDLMRSGGTILAAVKKLEELGAKPKSVTVRISHLVGHDTYAALFRLSKNNVIKKLIFSATTLQAWKATMMPELSVNMEILFPEFSPMFNPSKIIYPVLGSKSTEKVNAFASFAFGRIKGSGYAIDVNSLVPDAPYDDEGRDGASNRAAIARQYFSHVAKFVTGAEVVRTIGFGIENFIDTKEWNDVVCVVIDTERDVISHEEVCCAVPEEYRKRGLNVGETLQRDLNLTSKDAWIEIQPKHNLFKGNHRRQKIYEALVYATNKVSDPDIF